MKYKSLFALIFIFCHNIYSSEVSGNVYLDNNSNLENIKITFYPISPSAVFKEVFTGLNGSFATSVEDGIYDIIYSKNSYQDYILEEIFLNGVTTLEDVTLNSNTLIEVTGEVEGNWTNDNTYKVIGNITVPTNKSLNIQSGTEIKFDGYYSLIVNGNLLAKGTKESYIRFTSFKPSPTNKDWNQIRINSSNSTSIMDHCLVEYGKEDNSNNDGIIQVLGNALISNCIIRNSEETGIKVSSSNEVIIENNEVSNCANGIVVSGGGNITLKNNNVHDIQFIGIRNNVTASNTIIEGNLVNNCDVYGIQSWENIKISRNIIYNINSLSYSSGIFIAGHQPNIINNTLLNNANGIGIYDSDFFNPNPIINSNIIINSTFYAINSEGEPKPSLVQYNLFFNNSSGTGNNLPTGVGEIITTNTNGTSSDTYYNIYTDPLLISTSNSNTEFCELSSDSPAIDAGDPNYNDTDETIVDIGAKSFEQTLSISEIEDTGYRRNNLIVFPVPMNESITFESKVGFNEIEIYNPYGQKTYSANFSNKVYRHVFSHPSISTGLYFFIIKSNNKVINSGKFLKE